MSNSSDTTTYAWMGDNRLASVSSSSTAAAFTYDAEGKRTSKTIDGTTTKFVYDDMKLIAEKDGSGNISARYFYDDSGKLISMKKGGQSYYFHLNHRGDVISITNSAQAVVASYSYDPWGNILSSSGSFKDEQPFRYASYYWDKEIGMYYVINRYYDPVIGRFISKDPAGDPESAGSPAEMNPYAYAGNNPVMATDPDGLRLLYYSSPPMRGEDVRSLQNALIRFNLATLLAPYGADGIFGYLTKNAVKVFQSAAGIAADGVVGDATLGKLAAWTGPVSPAYGPPPAQTEQTAPKLTYHPPGNAVISQGPTKTFEGGTGWIKKAIHGYAGRFYRINLKVRVSYSPTYEVEARYKVGVKNLPDWTWTVQTSNVTAWDHKGQRMDTWGKPRITRNLAGAGSSEARPASYGPYLRTLSGCPDAVGLAIIVRANEGQEKGHQMDTVKVYFRPQ